MLIAAHEDCDLQHQQHQQAPAESSRLAEGRGARCCLPAGTESRRRRLSAGRDPRRRLRRRLAWAAQLERRCHPGEGRRSRSYSRRIAGRSNDTQSRYIEAAVRGILVTSIYLPNGNPQPGPKFDYKLAWFERLLVHARSLADSGHPVVLAGDYNVVPTDADIYATRSWLKNALLQPAPRAAYRRLLAQGWTDAIRALHPDERIYTFWDYLRTAWPRDAGLRIDHLLVSESLQPRLKRAGVDRDVRGRDNASDHAPVWIELA
jgi:exodeoxyribonuclease III